MEQKDNTKPYLIIIAILIFLIGIGTGYYVGEINKPLGPEKEETKKVQKKEETPIEEPKEENKIKEEVEEEPVEETKKENKTKEEDNNLATIISNDTKVEIKITLNNKKEILTFYNRVKEEKDSILTFGNTNINFLKMWGTGHTYNYAIPDKIQYTIIKGTDNKEYLVVFYKDTFDNRIIVLNDQTKIIGNIESFSKELDCYAIFKDYDVPVYKVEKNNIYFYRPIDSNYNKNYEIKLVLVKIDISNNTVTETKIDEYKTGIIAQCT